MQVKHILLLVTILGLITLACNLSINSDGPPRNAALVEVTANTSLTPWLQSAVENFNQAKVEITGKQFIFL